MRRLSFGPLPAVAALVGGVLAAGCSSAGNPPGPKFTVSNYPQPAVANAVAPGDPLWEGQYYLLYETWGADAYGGWPVSFLLQVLKDEPDFFGNQFSNFGFIPDPNDDLPIGLKRGTVDPTVAAETCAPCHTGRLPDGRIWFGQPNLQIDPVRLDYELNKRWIAAGHASMLSDATEQRSLAYGPGRFRIDSDGYPHAVAANIPVHYNLKNRSHLSTVGGVSDTRSDAYLAIGAELGFPLAGQDVKVPFPSDATLQALIDFMGSHDPPPPPAGDGQLVANGKAVFQSAHCGDCHNPDDITKDGVTKLDDSPNGQDRLPGSDPAYPRGTVHADPYQYYMAFGDPSMAGTSGGTLDPRTVTIIKFAYEHQLNVGQTDGYVAPNLHGIWASAPYLNNGSVPTLQDLLNPQSQRPATFMVGTFAFDTTVVGNSNQGHEFGTNLSPADKSALIAYLQSL